MRCSFSKIGTRTGLRFEILEFRIKIPAILVEELARWFVCSIEPKKQVISTFGSPEAKEEQTIYFNILSGSLGS